MTGPVRRGVGRRPPRAPARRARLGAVAAVMVLASVGLAVRLTVVQVVDGVRYAAYEKGEVDQKVVLGATRGAIYDSTGDVLAVSVPRTDVVADDFQITSPSPRRGRSRRCSASRSRDSPASSASATVTSFSPAGLTRRRGGPHRAS